LRQFLINSGYSHEAIDRYVKVRGDAQKNNMQKGIIALFFQNSEFSVVPRALNAWKDYVAERKRVKRVAQFVINRLRHPLAGWF